MHALTPARTQTACMVKLYAETGVVGKGSLEKQSCCYHSQLIYDSLSVQLEKNETPLVKRGDKFQMAIVEPISVREVPTIIAVPSTSS